MNESMKPILARLIAARKAAGLTQQEAAEAIGLTRASSLSDLETGRNEMKVSQLLALCELYRVSPARIMGSVLNEANKRMVDNRHSEPTVRTFQALQEIRIEAEEDLKYHADEDIPALLAHIEALEAELEAATFAVVWITSLPLSQIQAIRCAH